MDDITVSNRFLEDEELEKTMKIIEDTFWSFEDFKCNNPQKNPYWKIDLSDNCYFNDYIKRIIQTQYSKRFNVNKIYANGQTFGQDDNYMQINEGDNKYVFILFLSEIDKVDRDSAGGIFYINLPYEKYNICYHPKKNMGILLPSYYKFRNVSYSRYVNNIKLFIIWELEEII
jgi:hypothetical protein